MATAVKADKPAKAPKALVPCTCGQVTIVIPADSADRIPKKQEQFVTRAKDGSATIKTGCKSESKSKFAPGHDARTVGLLQTAVRLGGKAGFGSALADPQGFANDNLSEGLAAKIAHVPAVRAPKGKTVHAIVGRTAYEGKIKAGEFHYQNAKGEEKVAPEGKYEVVEDGE